jgi:hypothetical protein
MRGGNDTNTKDLRLYDLLMRFKDGDGDSFYIILKRFAWLIEKESYNSHLGKLDEDLRAQIYLYLFIRLKNYTIQDRANTIPANGTMSDA